MRTINREQLDYAANYLAYAAGKKSTVPLRVRNVVYAYLLHALYTWNVVGGTGAGDIQPDASHRIVNEVRMRGNDDDLQVFSGSFLYLYSLMFLSQLMPQVVPTTDVAGTVEANRESWLIIPGVMGHTYYPDEWGIPPLRDPTLTFHWADGSELVTSAADGAVSLTAVQLELYEKYFAPPVTPPPGGFNPLLIKQWEKAVLQNGKLQVDLEGLMSGPQGGPGHELRALFIEGLADGVAGAQFAHNDSVISTVKLSGSGKLWQELVNFSLIQAENVSEYQLAAKMTGVAVLDSAAHDRDTRRGQLWTVLGRETPVLDLEVAVQGAGQNRVRVTAVYTAGRYARAA